MHHTKPIARAPMEQRAPQRRRVRPRSLRALALGLLCVPSLGALRRRTTGAHRMRPRGLGSHPLQGHCPPTPGAYATAHSLAAQRTCPMSLRAPQGCCAHFAPEVLRACLSQGHCAHTPCMLLMRARGSTHAWWAFRALHFMCEIGYSNLRDRSHILSLITEKFMEQICL